MSSPVVAPTSPAAFVLLRIALAVALSSGAVTGDSIEVYAEALTAAEVHEVVPLVATAATRLRIEIARALPNEPRPLVVGLLAGALAALHANHGDGDLEPCLNLLRKARCALRAGVPEPLDQIEVYAARAVAEREARDSSPLGRTGSIARAQASADLLAEIERDEPAVHALLLAKPSTRAVLALLNVITRAS